MSNIGPATSDLMAKHHGEYIVRGSEMEAISGDWHPKRLIIVKFPDKTSVGACINDATYRQLSDLRQRALKREIVVVEGVWIQADQESNFGLLDETFL